MQPPRPVLVFFFSQQHRAPEFTERFGRELVLVNAAEEHGRSPPAAAARCDP